MYPQRPPTDPVVLRLLRGEVLPASPVVRFPLAVLLFSLSLASRLYMLPPGAGFLLTCFLPCVLAAALLLGAGPGLLTVGLSVVAGIWYSLLPANASASVIAAVLPLLTLAVAGVLICAVAHITRDALSMTRAQEHRFRALFESSGLGISRADLAGRFLEFNEAFRRITGYTREELSTLDLWALTSPTLHGAQAAVQAELERSGRYGPYEQEYVRADGTLATVRLQGVRVLARDGEPFVWSVAEDVTEVRRSQLLNERLLGEHRAVSESRVVGLVRVRDRRVVWCNRAFAEMFGYSRDELIGKPTRVFYPDEGTYEAFAAAAHPVLAGGGIYRTEIRQVRKDGSPAWFEISCGGGMPDAQEVVGAFVDCTRQRLAIEELARSEAQLRGAFSAMAEGLVVHAGDGTIVDANRAAELLLGLNRNQLLGRTSLDPGGQALREDGSTYPGDEHPAQVTLRTGRPLRAVSMGVRCPDGERRWLSINSQPVYAAHGDAAVAGVTGVVATFTDVTEQLALDAALTRARADLRAILDNVPAHITSWNADYTCRFLNRAAELRFGMTSAQAAGLALADVVGGARLPQAEQLVGAALAGESPWDERIEMNPDGSMQILRMHYVPDVRDGHVVGVYVLGTDVTELRSTLDRVRDLAERLESVREDERRVVSLSLHEGIAQELFAARLVLRGIRDMPAQGARPDEAYAQLETALDKCIADTRQVANDLRPAALGQARLSRLLGQHADYFGPLAGLQIAVSEAPDFPELHESERVLLFRVAQEALTNVARHAAARHVQVALRADAEHLVMEIADDGIGINPDALSKPGSLGILGLRERLHARAGTLSVLPRSEGGTMVRVILPRSDA